MFTIESTLPEDIPKKSLGSPSLRKSASLFQSGWAMIPTERPAFWRTLPITAVPKEG